MSGGSCSLDMLSRLPIRHLIAGWKAKRFEATEAEKRDHGETTKAKRYWVDVTYTP